MTVVGVALVAILICVDLAIWFNRGDDDVAASQGRQRAAATDQKAPRAPRDYVHSRVKAGDRLVTEHLLVTKDPIRSLVVGIRDTTAYADMKPRVSRLELSADGREVPVDKPLLRGTSTATIDLPKPAGTLELRFVTRGVVVPSVPSTAGRALTLANPLFVDVEAPAGREVVKLDGTEVLGMACTPGQRPLESCGRQDKNGGWRVELSRADAGSAVVAQVNIPSG